MPIMLEELRKMIRSEVQSTDTCQSPECGASTREGKPYCSAHIENCTYIRRVLAEIKRRESESKQLDSGRWIVQNAHLIREAMLLFAQRPYTAANLGRALDITERAAETLIRMMSRRGLIAISFSETGSVSGDLRQGTAAL